MMSHSLSSAGDATLMSLFRCSADRLVQQDAAQEFVERYKQKLMSLVQRNVSGRFGSRFDAEDVVQSVMNSWFDGIRKRRIHPTSASEFWPLIAAIALNKVRNRIRTSLTHKNDIFRNEAAGDLVNRLPEPTSEDAVEFEDMLEAICRNVDEKAIQILRLILEGYSVAEISDRIKVSTKTVQRRKKQLRKDILRHLPEDLRLVVESFSDDSEDELS
jgi:RNA polymerase sigma factor (sigma-70 family)